MTAKSRAERRRAARGRPDRQPSPTRWLIPAAGLLVVAVAVIAIVVSQGGGGPTASASPVPSAASVVTPPTISGDALPKFAATDGDPAVGLVAPVVQGHDYAGKAVGIAPSGKPTLVIFAAHWCPHCQREIPLIQDWINAGKAPKDVDMVSVSTGIDPSAPNYPPEAWLAREGWTVPVIVDPTNTVAAAYGLSSYPYFVLLDGGGKVVKRMAGEISMADLESILAAAPRS